MHEKVDIATDLFEAMSTSDKSDELSRLLEKYLSERSVYLAAIYDESIVYRDYGPRASYEEGLGYVQMDYSYDETTSSAIFSNPRIVRHESNWIVIPDAAAEMQTVEAITPLPLKLREVDSNKPFHATVKIIESGWGSSGFYSNKLLETYGPKTFAATTKMYWNHPSAIDETNRPERDLNDLAAILTEDAYYKDGALYAKALILPMFAEKVKSIHEADRIDVSIRASGTGHVGEVEGKEGIIVDSLLPSVFTSVDFVTEAGAGGRVLELLEEKSVEEIETVTIGDKSVKLLERMAKSQAETEARNYMLSSFKSSVPSSIKKRVIESVMVKLPFVDDDGLQVLDMTENGLPKVFSEALDAELEYYKSIIGGSNIIREAGGVDLQADAVEITEAEIDGAFKRLGIGGK